MFQADNTVIVSTYSRGLWVIDFNVRLFDQEVWCEEDCLFSFVFSDGNFPDPVDWTKLDVTIFLNGEINGLALSDNHIKQITVTPGTVHERYVGHANEYPELLITESKKGKGFRNLKGCQAAVKNGQVIKGIILDGDIIVGVITGKSQFQRETTSLKQVTSPQLVQKIQTAKEGEEIKKVPSAPQTYFSVTTSIPSTGLPIVGRDRMIHVLGRGFQFTRTKENFPVMMIDGQIVEIAIKVSKNGSLDVTLQIANSLRLGEHTIEIRQKTDGKELIAHNRFATATHDADEK